MDGGALAPDRVADATLELIVSWLDGLRYGSRREAAGPLLTPELERFQPWLQAKLQPGTLAHTRLQELAAAPDDPERQRRFAAALADLLGDAELAGWLRRLLAGALAEALSNLEPSKAGVPPDVDTRRGMDQYPAPGPTPADAEQRRQRWLNHMLLDQEHSRLLHSPLQLGQVYTLAIAVETEARGTPVPLDESRPLAEGGVPARLTVQVTSGDFEVYTREPQTLLVPATGRSRNTARFDLEPREEGTGELRVILAKDNNFIQGVRLRVRVGGDGEPVAGVERLGRPLGPLFPYGGRDYSLIITPGNGPEAAFDVTLIGAVATTGSLGLTPAGLEARVGGIRSTLRDVVWLALDHHGPYVYPKDEAPDARVPLPYQDAIDKIPQEVYEETLRRLAKAGALLYHEIFYASNDAQSALIGDRLRALAQQPGQTLKIQIVSQQFLLPWAVLYTGEYDPERVDPELFLGLRHIIEHIPLQKQWSTVDREIPSEPELSVSLNIDDDIDQKMNVAVVRSQRAYWDQIGRARGARVIVRATDRGFVEALANEAAPDQILYFYGHAAPERLGGVRSGYLQFTGGRRVSLDDLKLRAREQVQLPKAPLVFINACNSSQLSPLFYSGFMPYFTAKGARGLIGTECEIPAVFADIWARHFFDLFLAGEGTLGHVLLHLRRQFHDQYRNLLGLFYTLYCDGDTRVVPGLRLT